MFMFTLTFVVAYCLLYLGLVYLFPLFFTGAWGENQRINPWSLVLIIIVTFITFSLFLSVDDYPLANRLQHALGGGFLGFMVCFLAWRSSRLTINRFQFFLFSFLIVIALGVANEIVEYVLQNYFSMLMARTINDTWLDLISNIVGILVGSAIFVPLLSRRFQEGAEERVGVKGC